jgi:hypothetical protein
MPLTVNEIDPLSLLGSNLCDPAPVSDGARTTLRQMRIARVAHDVPTLPRALLARQWELMRKSAGLGCSNRRAGVLLFSPAVASPIPQLPPITRT